MIDYFCFPSLLSSILMQKENRLLYEECVKNKDYERLSWFLFNVMVYTLEITSPIKDESLDPEQPQVPGPSPYIQLVIKEALISNKCILYDFSNNTFVDIKNSPVIVRNKSLYFFSHLYLFPYMVKVIKEEGGIPIISKITEQQTLNWFKYFPIKDRKMINTTYGELLINMDRYLKTLGRNNQLFIKTVHKGISGIYTHNKHGGEFEPADGIGDLTVLNPRTSILVSTPLEIIKDDYGKREWRAFVMKGVIQNISRKIYGIVLPIEPYVIEYIKQQVKIANATMPLNSYVIDFMEYQSEKGFPVLTVTEFNTITYSNIRSGNTRFPILKKKTIEFKTKRAF